MVSQVDDTEREIKDIKMEIRISKAEKNETLQIYKIEKITAENKMKAAQEAYVRMQALVKMTSNDVRLMQNSLMEQLAREEALLRKMEEKYAYQDDDSETIDEESEVDKSIKITKRKVRLGTRKIRQKGKQGS